MRHYQLNMRWLWPKLIALCFLPACQTSVDKPVSQLPILNAAPFLNLKAEGVQTYRCGSLDGTGYAWKFVAPTAVLRGENGLVVQHGSGPTWAAPDGSRIVGEVISSRPSPSLDSIAWLQLKTHSVGGTGLLSQTRFINRIDTEGGKPNPAECSKSKQGHTIDVPYKAVYVFYR